MSSMEDDLNQLKVYSRRVQNNFENKEDDLQGRQSLWKTTSKEDDPAGNEQTSFLTNCLLTYRSKQFENN